WGTSCLVYFGYRFPAPMRLREGLVVLGLLFALDALAFSMILVRTAGAEATFDFAAGSWNFAPELLRPVALVLILKPIWFFVTMARKIPALEGRERRAALAMTLVVAAALGSMTAANVLRQSGRLEPAPFQNIFN